MTWMRSRPYLLLLIALLLLIVLVPAAPTTVVARVIAIVLLLAVLLTGLRILIRQGNHRGLSIALCLAATIGNLTGLAVHDDPHVSFTVAIHLLTAAFLGFALVSIVGTIYRGDTVTAEGVCAGLCGYLVVGLIFAHFYSIIEAVAPGSFKGDDELAAALREPIHARIRLTYFSFVTLTTLGYGDITPARGITRGLAMAEAVVGQFYVAVLIADLVGKKIALAMLQRTADSTSTGK